MRCVIVVAALTMQIGGCGSASSQSGTTGPQTGANGPVTGHALAGPTCPVERPGDPNCQPRPVQGSVRFAEGGHVVSSNPIDATGAFVAELPAGTYTVTVDTGDNPFPVCTPVEVEVLLADADADSVVDISCDTGIR